MSRSFFNFLFALAASAALAGCASATGGAGVGKAAQTANFTPSPQAMRAHVEFLASDLLEGRETGTRGYDIAVSYVAAQFRALGLAPAGDPGSYLQRTPLVGYWPTSQGRVTLRSARGRTIALKFGEDYLPQPSPTAARLRISATPLVFAGFGMVAPERGRDDYAGLDVAGKVVVLLNGAPSGLQSEERAYYASSRVKRAAAEARGAAGVIFVDTPPIERTRPFAKNLPTWADRRLTWRAKDGAPFVVAPRSPGLASVSLKGAEKLFAGAPQPLEAIMRAAETPAGDPPRFELPARVSLTVESASTSVDSANVAALVRGSDDAAGHEVVVLSAHLDHMGVGPPVNGDRIYNGAMDNAVGVATLLEAARGFTAPGASPRRSVLLLAFTGEEQGLVGSEYFAHNPTVPRAALVAAVNLDMPILNYPFVDVVAFGGERSSIGGAVRRAAEGMGVSLAADFLPGEGLFTRSDHYRFVEQGVPAVFLITGPGAGGAKATQAFLATRYHQPNDDLDQPLDYASAARFAKLNYEIARELADAPARPSWNVGDFFGRTFGGAGPLAPAALDQALSPLPER